MTRWMATADMIARIRRADLAIGEQAFGADGFAIVSPGGRGLLPAMPEAASYKSLARLLADLSPNGVGPGQPWLLYDPENWDQTPAAEQAGPWTAMRQFGQLAHSHGYRVIMAPARDLGNVARTLVPRLADEDITAWYLRTCLAATAASFGDAIDIQAQYLAPDPAAYAAFVTAAAQQARDANPWCLVLAGISTAHGTAAQMAEAVSRVSVDGFWLNVPGPAPDVAEAVAFLRLVL